jgi:hypothetical protein
VKRYCSPTCRFRAHNRRWSRVPSFVERHRASMRRRRGGGLQVPALRAAPAFGDHLPGGGTDLTIGAQFVEPRHTRLIHGLLTALVGEGHDPTRPAWALVPWHTGCGWAVYWWEEEHLRRFAGTRHEIRFGESRTVATFGPAGRIRTPQVARRGRQRVRIDSLTPVVIRKDGGTHTYTAPTAETLISSLSSSLRPRLGLGRETEDLVLDLVERHTEPDSVWCGEKLGAIRGWQGWVVCEVNAPARWLLEVAARGPGLGGRTGYGFGRVRVCPA